MQIKYFPVNSKNSYVIFQDNDKIEELEPFMKENKLSRIIFSGFLGYSKSVLPFNEDIDLIEEISIQCSDITDLTSLYHLSNIKKISIEENAVLAHPFDIRKIAKLTDFFTDDTKKLDIHNENNILESLSIANSHILDLSSCKKLTQLKGLYIAYLPKIENINFILDMPTLTDIEICSCKKIDNLIATLAQKNNLEKLTLWNQENVDSIIPLSKLEHLTTLDIWEQTKIIDGKISFLEKMPNLKKIDIRKYTHYH